MFRSVDFPQPEGPTKMKSSPSRIVKLARFKAVTPEKRLVTPSSSISATCSPLHSSGGEPGDDAPLKRKDYDDDW